MKLVLCFFLLFAGVAQAANDCSGYDGNAVHDGHLTVHDAFSHYWCGGGVPVTVDAARLTVQQVGSWNADGWSSGVVQGVGGDFLVHGRVGLFNRNGAISIQPELFNFEQRNDASTVREIEVMLGRVVVGDGTAYEISFAGQPRVVTDGYTYYQ
jgi:hypothetical protein